MQYYIGIDGGGTKTAVCAVGIDDFSLRYAKTVSSSWREHGACKAAQILRDAVDSLAGGESDRIAGIAMGLPCYGESAEGDRALESALLEKFAGIPLYFTNDVEVGWAGSMALEPGINVVAGTGSIAFGKDIHGNTARSGGWGEFFGDEGSCYWVGHKAMELFSKQSDGRMPKDELYEVVRSEFELESDFSFIDLMHGKYLGFRERVASLQLLVEKAALAGAPSAKAVYEEAARELSLLVLAVKNRLDFSGGDKTPWAVSYSGGLFKAGDLILPRFAREIDKAGGTVAAPRFGPVEGAVLLAFRNFYPEGLTRIQKVMQNSKN